MIDLKRGKKQSENDSKVDEHPDSIARTVACFVYYEEMFSFIWEDKCFYFANVLNNMLVCVSVSTCRL